MQAGIENMHKDSKYVLFLDDDVRLHPGSIGALTAEMQKNPEVCSIFPLICLIFPCFSSTLLIILLSGVILFVLDLKLL